MSRRQATVTAPAIVAGPALRDTLLLAAVLAAVLVSCLAVIRSSHACRQLYAQLQSLEATRWHLQEDYSRLLLEQSTWASHHRVEQVAADDLGMRAPSMAYRAVVEQ
ncbi:cell division protein FtsL [Parahalioglobus pacificus]|uniref:Cell division protein FtsL n=1 Tax=Parahalioglobus pacificus TaxID=930806 RepID=A0A918XC83_9GAMM|nr:cell division protein FtsL [Halioglobus pacificus]GHD25940.1 hypothetical protein GCM10007053_02320 [Halioglobus pacificus]